MQSIVVPSTKEKEVIIVTDHIQALIKEQRIQNGFCHLQLLHTTAAITIADMADYGMEQDIIDALSNLVPKLQYHHPHNPAHLPDHILSLIIGTSLTLPIQESRLVLGTWQEVILLEFDGPRQRNLHISFFS